MVFFVHQMYCWLLQAETRSQFKGPQDISKDFISFASSPYSQVILLLCFSFFWPHLWNTEVPCPGESCHSSTLSHSTDNTESLTDRLPRNPLLIFSNSAQGSSSFPKRLYVTSNHPASHSRTPPSLGSLYYNPTSSFYNYLSDVLPHLTGQLGPCPILSSTPHDTEFQKKRILGVFSFSLVGITDRGQTVSGGRQLWTSRSTQPHILHQ